MSTSSGAEKFIPEPDADQTGDIISGEERDEGVGELTPLPEDAGGDPPPEHDVLAEIEEATGNVLSDDLTAEATRLTGDDTNAGLGGPRRQ